jgi:hypothetical protein
MRGQLRSEPEKIISSSGDGSSICSIAETM